MPKTPLPPLFKKTANTRSPVRQSTEPALTVKEIAILDGCSVKTVRRAIKAGLLVALRVGPGARLLRVTAAAHEAYRNNQRR